MADDHWKLIPGEQHHQRAFRLGLNWYEGNITKYAERCRFKGVWLDDVLKILDYTVLYMETYKDTAGPLSPHHIQKLENLSDRIYELANIGDAWERRQLNKALNEAAKRGDPTRSYVDQG